MAVDDVRWSLVVLRHDDGLHLPKNLGVDLELGINEVIQRVMHGTLGAVLNGQHGVIDLTRGDAGKGSFNSGFGDLFDAVAELVHGDLMRP